MRESSPLRVSASKYSVRMTVVSVALVNDYEVVLHGLLGMLRSYQDRVKVVELDLNRPVSTPVDVVLYDTFAATQGDRDEVRATIAPRRLACTLRSGSRHERKRSAWATGARL